MGEEEHGLPQWREQKHRKKTLTPGHRTKFRYRLRSVERTRRASASAGRKPSTVSSNSISMRKEKGTSTRNWERKVTHKPQQDHDERTWWQCMEEGQQHRPQVREEIWSKAAMIRDRHSWEIYGSTVVDRAWSSATGGKKSFIMRTKDMEAWKEQEE
jgi:hypothetical protein